MRPHGSEGNEDEGYAGLATDGEMSRSLLNLRTE